MKIALVYRVLSGIVLVLTTVALIFRLSSYQSVFQHTIIYLMLALVLLFSWLLVRTSIELRIKKHVEMFMFTCMTIAIVLFVNVFIVSIAIVDGNSMEPTLSDRNMVISYHFMYEPQVQDIVIIDHPIEGKLIKRIWAKEGDEIAFVNFKLIINGYETAYTLNAQMYDEIMKETDGRRVKEGYYLVLGDNSAVSKDSRSFGLIKRSYIIGKMLVRIG